MGTRKIYEALRDQIQDGIFGTEGRLPSSRALARELGVSRTTMTLAYEQLLAEGFIAVQRGSCPRVASDLFGAVKKKVGIEPVCPIRLSSYGERIRDFRPAPTYTGSKLLADFRYGDMSSADFPTIQWKRAVSLAASQQADRLNYADPHGSLRLRVALQGYLWRTRQLNCEPEHIIIVNGSQQGLDLCARLFLDAGDTFVIENPAYAMARQVLTGTGAAPISIPVDQDGMKTELLAGVSARLAYVTPSHQFPLGGVMPITRRHQLLDWAQRNGAWIIEDDYDSEYRYDIKPVPSLQGLDGNGRVIYLGTISKTLSPRLRVGYLVVPPSLQVVVSTAKRLADRHSPITEQEALATLIDKGTYERHVRRVRRLNSHRRVALIEALGRHFGNTVVIEGADAGLHIVVWFPDLPAACEGQLLECARNASIGIYSISGLYDDGSADRLNCVGLVMGYAALEPKLIERGVQLLADTIEGLRSRR